MQWPHFIHLFLCKYIFSVISCPAILFGAFMILPILNLGIYLFAIPAFNISIKFLQSLSILSSIFFSNSKNLLTDGAIIEPSLAGLLYALSIIVQMFFSNNFFANILFVSREHNPRVLYINAGFSSANLLVLSQ